MFRRCVGWGPSRRERRDRLHPRIDGDERLLFDGVGRRQHRVENVESESAARPVLAAAAQRPGHVDNPDAPAAFDTGHRDHVPLLVASADDPDVAAEVVGIRAGEGCLGAGDLDDADPGER